MIATAPTELLQPLNAPGYILFSPVFNERGFVGCITFVFRVDQLLNRCVTKRKPYEFPRLSSRTEPGQLKYLLGIPRQGKIDAVNASFLSDGAETIGIPWTLQGESSWCCSMRRPIFVQVGVQPALLVGLLGLMLTGIIVWGMNRFMRSSRRLAY